MTSNKHFLDSIYANHNAKLENFLPVPVSKACFARKIFMVVKIYINSAPALLTKFLNYFYFFLILSFSFVICLFVLLNSQLQL